MERIRHDVAWKVSLHILEALSPLLRDEQQCDTFREVYELVKAGLLAYDQEIKALLRRLKPLSNG